MADTYKAPGQYSLDKFSVFITDEASNEEDELDFRQVFFDITLYESIFDIVMSGNASIIDTENMKDRLPLYGNERIEIEWHTAGNEENPIKFTGQIFKIEPKSRITEHSGGYVIHFASPEMISSARSQTQRGYNDTPVNIIKDIYSRIARRDNPKQIESEECNVMTALAFGSHKPFEAISITTKRATTSDRNGWLFWEDSRQFNFKSIETLYTQEPITEFIYRNSGTFQDVQQRHVERFTAIQDITVLEDDSFIDRIAEGQHGSRWLFLDLTSKTLNEINYTKTEYYNPEKSLGKLPVKRDLDNPEYTDDWEFGIGFPDQDYLSFVKGIMLKRNCNMYRARISINGDTAIRSGLVCKGTLPAWNRAENADTDMIKGKFLFTEVKHVLGRKTYNQVLMIQKDAYEEI